MNSAISQIYSKKFNSPLNISDTEPTLPPSPPEMNEEEANSLNDESTNAPAPDAINSLQKYIHNELKSTLVARFKLKHAKFACFKGPL